MSKKTEGQPANKSAVWDEKFHKTGKQHTIYAPQAFFDHWFGESSKLKAHVNAWLLENDVPVTMPPKKDKPVSKPKSVQPAKKAVVTKPKAPAFTEFTDDDI